MNEAALMRALRQCRKVRGPDFHQPATRANEGKIESGNGRIEKRQPLTKEERAEAENTLAAAAAAAGNGDGMAADEGAENTDPQQALGDGGEAGPELIEPANFLKEFDAWVDGKYPGDRGSATKVKVAFRKQHRAMVAGLNLEDIEEIAQAMQ
eukprot:g10632.t1